MKKRWLVLLLTVLSTGCASDVNVAYPAPAADRTGVVLVRFTEPMTSVSVRIEGVLVAEDRHTERIEVTGVPAGSREVAVVASESSRTEPVRHLEQVTVDPDRPAVVLIGTPPLSTGYWIHSAATFLAYAALVLSWNLR